MLQRTILRQRRAVQSAVSRSSTFSSQSPFRQASPLQQLSQRQSAFKVAVPRFYSTQNDAATKDDAKEASKENGEAESPEETFKKELEAKNKEVAEMKVSAISTPPAGSHIVRN
jgi:molecular chaperone GrpE